MKTKIKLAALAFILATAATAQPKTAWLVTVEKGNKTAVYHLLTKSAVDSLLQKEMVADASPYFNFYCEEKELRGTRKNGKLKLRRLNPSTSLRVTVPGSLRVTVPSSKL